MGGPRRCSPRWWPRAGRSARSGWSTRCGDPTTCRPTPPRRSRSSSPAPARRPRPEVVVRTDHGYRLGLRADQVDALALRDAVVGSPRGRGPPRPGPGPRPRPRRPWRSRPRAAPPRGPWVSCAAPRRRQRTIASAVLGRALSALGDHDEALALLVDVGAGDEASMAALLRSTAAVHGAPAALDRYERHRIELADRLGVDPGPALRAVHGELLAADRPVREGLRFETTLAGRPRRGHPGAAGRRPRLAGHLDPRSRRARQDPARAPARPRGRAAGRPLRRAGRRLLAGGRRRRGRLRPRRPRLGERPTRAHPRAAQRRARARSPSCSTRHRPC